MDQYQFDQETASFIDGSNYEAIRTWQTAHGCPFDNDMTVDQALRYEIWREMDEDTWLAARFWDWRRKYRKAQVQP